MRNLSEHLTRSPLLLEKVASRGQGRTGFWARRVGAGQFSRQGAGQSSRAPSYGVNVGSGYMVDPYQEIIRRGRRHDNSVRGTAAAARDHLQTIYGVRGPDPHFFGQ